MSGVVHLVGAGPGAPDLLTLRAVRLLGEADIVFYDALVSEEILNLIATDRKIAVGKRSGRHSTAQHFINKRLLDAARRHRTVVRLKGGDPMLFGRAHEEIEFLQANGVAVEVVPGITAALAASADLRVSLTRRGRSRSVTFVTPRVAEGARASSWLAAAMAADTAAIYMGAGEGAAIAAALLAAGKPRATPVAVVENASRPDVAVRFGTLGTLSDIAPPVLPMKGISGENRVPGPSLILIGEVFGAAQALTGEVAVLRAASQSA